MNALFQLVTDQDLGTLLELMREFYPQQHMRLDATAAAAAAKRLLQEPGLGQIYFIFHGAELAGYFVMTFCYSLEFHGSFALLDELYLREPFRRRRLGAAAVAFAQSVSKKAGAHALRLEVGQSNDAAQALYSAAGLARDERFLYTKWL